MIDATPRARRRATPDPFSTMGNNALRHNHGTHVGELGSLHAEKVVARPGNTYTITPYFGTAG